MMLSTAIKKIALNTTNASAPVSIIYGVVLQSQPLQIQVDQRFTLSEAFLVLPESLIRKELDLTTGEVTSGSDSSGSSGSSEASESTGKKAVLQEGLQPGDQVILMRVQGGQSYLVLDKVVSS
ncbi:DUF2577 domain-containing protein [Paenibacillus sp. 1001270B_150601_E10]|uniref:DUF2577 domain-containing protein n=1 Tax=Paenibacillus sp. 1001270B_150601_E10 TaxID=2787079 RepID=UPI00189FFEFB|nr:DUF2577 domain-containing protein [Paenibacillus sp. 1001270B_150601_E10]